MIKKSLNKNSLSISGDIRQPKIRTVVGTPTVGNCVTENGTCNNTCQPSCNGC